MVFTLPFIAIFIGFFGARFFTTNDKRLMYLLSFSGAFLLSVTLLEMLPEVYTESRSDYGIWIMGGILLQIILDFFSKGAEHGHVHLPENLIKFPWLLFLSLSVHSLLEGFPIVDNHDVLWGVVIHKIPIAIILTLFFKRSGIQNTITWVFLLLFALMTPLGSLIANYGALDHGLLMKINALAIGVFLHVSTTILFESSKDHRFNLTKLLTIFAGVLLAYFL